MRFLVSLPDDQAAHIFTSYLLTRGINATVEQGANGFAVWVHDDDKVADAAAELEQFQKNPEDPRFAAATQEAQDIRAFAERHAERRRRQYIDVRTHWSRAAGAKAPLTILLIVISCIVAAMTNVGAKPDVVNRVSFAPSPYVDHDAVVVPDHYDAPAYDILHGQVWRIITPIFLHFGYLHILFNMMWLFQLGSMIEARKGTLTLAALVIVSGILGNIGEYAVLWKYAAAHADVAGQANAGSFGGMSGVVYALLGYIWMKHRYQPYEQLAISRENVIFMLVWLVICMTGWIGHVANAAHFIGLVVGVAAGAFPTLWKRATR